MEEKILIEFDENGEIVVETRGIKGKACLDDVKDLLEGVATITHEHKTDEYYSGNSIKNVIDSRIEVKKR